MRDWFKGEDAAAGPGGKGGEHAHIGSGVDDDITGTQPDLADFIRTFQAQTAHDIILVPSDDGGKKIVDKFVREEPDIFFGIGFEQPNAFKVKNPVLLPCLYLFIECDRILFDVLSFQAKKCTRFCIAAKEGEVRHAFLIDEKGQVGTKILRRRRVEFPLPKPAFYCPPRPGSQSPSTVKPAAGEAVPQLSQLLD
ncbi:MAG: hypothetical protein LUG50_04060 [Planctomycetaceae bacterium]|nr:hypothetical protein [Planctomycetaceae bacterium]